MIAVLSTLAWAADPAPPVGFLDRFGAPPVAPAAPARPSQPRAPAAPPVIVVWVRSPEPPPMSALVIVDRAPSAPAEEPPAAPAEATVPPDPAAATGTAPGLSSSDETFVWLSVDNSLAL